MTDRVSEDEFVAALDVVRRHRAQEKADSAGVEPSPFGELEKAHILSACLDLLLALGAAQGCVAGMHDELTSEDVRGWDVTSEVLSSFRALCCSVGEVGECMTALNKVLRNPIKMPPVRHTSPARLTVVRDVPRDS